MGERLAGEIIDALDQQTVTVVGTNAATIVLPQLARMLADIRESRDTVFTQVEALVEARALHPVLTSLPAVGVRTAARILTEIVGKRAEGKRHNQALIALGRRRCDTLCTMLRDGTFYEPRTPSAA